MPGIGTHVNLLLSRKFQKEALEFASEYGSNKYCIICFTESDLTDYEPGNLIGKINALSEEGFIKWDYVSYKKSESDENLYQIKDITLTVEGEKLLRSFSLLSNTKPILIGTITCRVSAYLAIKFGFF